MSYFSSNDYQPSLSGLGCGPGCGCSPCRSGSGALSEWYVKDEEEPESQKRPPPPAPTKAQASPAGSSQTKSRNTVGGWAVPGLGAYGFGSGNYFSEAPAPTPARLRYPEVNTQLPASGVGYYTYYVTDRRGRLDDPPGYHRYARSEVIRAVQSIAAEWQRLHPRGPRLGVGDLSLLGGGPTPRHGAHQRGLEVDLRPLRVDGREQSVTYTDPNYSRALTQQLVEVIRRNSALRVRAIFFNDPGVRGVTPLAGHANHLHVGFLPSQAPASPAGSSGARRSRPTQAPATRVTGHMSSTIVSRTNEIFYARHPELRRRPIRPGEKQLTAEWVAIRNSLLRGEAPPVTR